MSFSLLAIGLLVIALPPGLSAGLPTKLVIDTDMGFDVDDVVAVCLGNELQRLGAVDLLAVVHNTGCHLGIGGVSAINHFYGHDSIELGAWKGRFGSNCDKHFEGRLGQDQYLSKIISDPSTRGPVTSSAQVPRGVETYRKVLAGAPNASVSIASIGMLTNLRDLLASPPDRVSPLSGRDLVAAKVAKIVFMNGWYNFECATGLIGPAAECQGSAQAVLKMMPPQIPLVASGTGSDPNIFTGNDLQTAHPPNSPCRQALKNWCCNPNGQSGVHGRLSWDPIAVMIASLGVGSVLEKPVDFGTRWSANINGTQDFFGNGTLNYRTGFASSDSPSQITQTINALVNIAPSPPPLSSEWAMHAGNNCYGSRDGQAAHGAKDLEHPSWAAAGPPMTLKQCAMLCTELGGCTGFTVQPAKVTTGLFDCYRKADIEISKCDHDTVFDTYTHSRR
jgi:hypothetical protein